MRIKLKTVRRLLLLAVVSTLGFGALFSLVVVRGWQSDRQTRADQREGMQAFAAGRHRQAVEALGRYIRRAREPEAEALLAYAQARTALPQPDLGHLHLAISAYQSYLSLVPADERQRLALIRLCSQVGEFELAREHAERLRPADLSRAGPQHVDALREEALALSAIASDPARLGAVVECLLRLAPLDLTGNFVQLEAADKAGEAAEARRRAQGLAAAHPDDPTAQLIGAASWLIGGPAEDANIARSRIAQAVGLDPTTGEVVQKVRFPGSEFVARVVDIFDRMHEYELSLAVLRRWHEDQKDPWQGGMDLGLRRSLARRLWQIGDHEGELAILGAVPPENADSELLAFRALSLQRSSGPTRRAEAAAIIEALGDRGGDYRAAAWAVALPLADPEREPDPQAEAEVIRDAIRMVNRTEPVLQVMLGEALAAQGHVDDARLQWSDAAKSPLASGWPYPELRIAETLLAEGREEDALGHASRALILAHDSPTVNALWFEVQAARLQKGGASELEPGVLQTLERAIEQLERVPTSAEVRDVWERLLSPRVLFLARSGQRADAVQAARAALDAPRPLAERTLLRLASVSESEGLGLESECRARAASLQKASPAPPP